MNADANDNAGRSTHVVPSPDYGYPSLAAGQVLSWHAKANETIRVTDN